MAKSTRAQQISTGTSDSYTAHEKSDPTPPVRIKRAMLGEVDKPSVGMNSSQSSESETTSSGKENQSRQQPAQMTESHFKVTEAADSDADSTVGAGQKTEEQKSGKKTPAKKTRVKSTDENLDDDFDFS